MLNSQKKNLTEVLKNNPVREYRSQETANE